MTAVIAVDTEKKNASLFFDEMDRLLGASIGVVAIRTREIERCRQLLHQWASIRDADFSVWTTLNGWESYRKLPVTSADDPRPSIEMNEDVEKLLVPHETDPTTAQLDRAWEKYADRRKKKQDENNRFFGAFIGITQEMLENAGLQQHIRNHVQRAYENHDRAFIILSPGISLPEAIASDVEIVDLYTPSFAELLEALNDFAEDSIPEDIEIEFSEDDKFTLVQNGLGMTQQEFENALSLSVMDIKAQQVKTKGKKKEVTVDDFIKVMRERKLEILKKTKILELLPEADISEIGGLDLIKEYLLKRKSAYTPEAKAFGIKPPKGIVAVGPPGTGKSLLLRAIGAILGIPAIKVDVGAIYGSLVGSSEARARMVTQMLESMAPCVAGFDEIDKSIGGGGGGGERDGGTSQRVFGHILTWFQEKADKEIPVYAVASANNVEHMPPEILRKGRFDSVWCISFPNVDERLAIVRIHVEKRGHKMEQSEYLRIARTCDGYVGSEIESAIEDALLDDFDAGEEGLTSASVIRALEHMTPQAKAFPERIARMKNWAEKNARMASSKASFTVAEESAGSIKPVKRKPTLRKLRSTRN